jgi:hypothetical protein
MAVYWGGSFTFKCPAWRNWLHLFPMQRAVTIPSKKCSYSGQQWMKNSMNKVRKKLRPEWLRYQTYRCTLSPQVIEGSSNTVKFGSGLQIRTAMREAVYESDLEPAGTILRVLAVEFRRPELVRVQGKSDGERLGGDLLELAACHVQKALREVQVLALRSFIKDLNEPLGLVSTLTEHRWNTLIAPRGGTGRRGRL